MLLCNKSFPYYKFHNKAFEREKSKNRTIYYNIHHRRIKLALFGPRFEDSEKLTRRDLRFASSLIGFVWVRFNQVSIFIFSLQFVVFNNVTSI